MGSRPGGCGDAGLTRITRFSYRSEVDRTEWETFIATVLPDRVGVVEVGCGGAGRPQGGVGAGIGGLHAFGHGAKPD